ncbi:MAG: guanylate kinase [Gaiellales bacterium]
MSRLFVISGPSGAGKGTLIRGVLEARPDLARVATSATTRAMRPGEVQGREYHFMTVEEFARGVADGEFEEWVEFAGNRYGTLKREIDGILAQGANVILELEVEGSLLIKERRPDAVLVFIDCDPDALHDRLVARQTESSGEITERLRIAVEQGREKHRFDHVVVNERVDDAVEELLLLLEGALRG